MAVRMYVGRWAALVKITTSLSSKSMWIVVTVVSKKKKPPMWPVW